MHDACIRISCGHLLLLLGQSSKFGAGCWSPSSENCPKFPLSGIGKLVFEVETFGAPPLANRVGWPKFFKGVNLPHSSWLIEIKSDTEVLTGVSYLDTDLDIVTGLWYTDVPNFGSLSWMCKHPKSSSWFGAFEDKGGSWLGFGILMFDLEMVSGLWFTHFGYLS